MEDHQKPHAFGLVESHLKGTDLNAARRRFSSLGWKAHCTPAVAKAAKRFGQDEENLLAVTLRLLPRSFTTRGVRSCLGRLTTRPAGITKTKMPMVIDQSLFASGSGLST
jgi:hypothetical protein